MANFPTLSTGALAQYPLSVSSSFRTEVVQFLDGSRQTFALQGGLRRWAVLLDQLTPVELSQLDTFAASTAGGTFSFTDPTSGVVVAKCVLRGTADFQVLDECSGKAKLTVEEVL